MSGPIVRKYGFPNFEKIFGKRPLEHGVDEKEEAEGASKKAEMRSKAEETAEEMGSRPEEKAE
jgi:hypothetical protein